MTTYTPSEKILQIAIIEGDVAICRICGERKSLQGIFTHHFRMHTQEGKAHTEKIKNCRVDYVRNVTDVYHCDVCCRNIRITHKNQHQKACEAHQTLLLKVVGAPCEACGKSIEKLYGSGRFCCVRCAVGKSARSNTVEKNRKISESLSRRARIVKIVLSEDEKISRDSIKSALRRAAYQAKHHDKDNKNRSIIFECSCNSCGTTFTSRKNPKEFCSVLCFRTTPEYREKMRLSTLRRIERGAQYPRGIKCKFNFRGAEIRCDSGHEWICLNWITSKYDVLKIDRSQLRLDYEIEGLQRKYNPDFHITTLDGKLLIVEAKMDQKQGNTTLTKYLQEAQIKKEILKSYCELNNIEMVWFTQNTDRSSYRKISKAFKLERDLNTSHP